MTTTNTALVSIRATGTDEYLPANRLAVSLAVFDRLCRESGDEGLASGAPGCDQLHITKGDDTLDMLDDNLRDRAQTVGAFDGGECWALLPGQGIDGCDVWARTKVEVISAEDAAAMGVAG